MELNDKTYSIELDKKEYLKRCEKLYEEETNLLRAIIQQCSNKNLQGRYGLDYRIKTSEHYKTIYHYILPSGLHVYANQDCERNHSGYLSLMQGVFILPHELSPEVLQRPKSFLQLAEGVDALLQWGEAGRGPIAVNDYITYRINAHCKQGLWAGGKPREDDYYSTSDLHVGFRSYYDDKERKNYHITSTDNGTFASPMALDGTCSILPDVFKGVIDNSSLSEEEKKEYHQKFLPLYQMLSIERAKLKQQEAGKSPLQLRRDEKNLLEAEAQTINEAKNLIDQQQGQPEPE